MKPILFNTIMTRAVADDLKTATRRIANINTEILCNDAGSNHEFVLDSFNNETPTGFVCRRCGFGVASPHSRVPCGSSLFRPRYWPGDILYVRENWSIAPDILRETPGPVYMADFSDAELNSLKAKHFRWKPSIHMPARIARLFLRVTGVRVERLQDISAEECAMEGVPLYAGPVGGRETYYKTSFAKIWDSTIPKNKLPVDGWDANPWVWAYRFERISKEEAQKGENHDITTGS